jgi:nucleotide-binding universal stress UspA family protein
VHAAMPWMQKADSVAILAAEGYQRRGPGASELAAFLDLHGINTDIITFKSVNGSVGAGLLSSATAFGCDLLSMGAYSHSRLRQLILGGVTRHVLENSSLPVMMNR